MQHFDVWWTDTAGNIVAPVVGREEKLSIRMNADAALKRSGSMVVHELPDWVNPYEHRVLVEDEGVALGLFVVDADTPQTSRTNRLTRVALIDPIKLVQVRELSAPVTVPAGANIPETVARFLADLGESRLVVTPSDAETRAPQVWMPGDDSWLTVINDLLTSANYWALHTDNRGRFVVAPYILPADRPIAHSFVAGDGSVMVGDYSEDRDYWAVPNRFIAICPDYVPEGSDADPVTLVGVAENRDPLSPFSFQARGERWVDTTDTVEATSQKDIDGIAARRLAAITGGGDYVSVKHLPLPHLGLQDRVHVSTAAGDVFDATVNEVTITEHGLTSAKWKRITNIEGGGSE